MTDERQPGRLEVAWWPTSEDDHSALAGLVADITGIASSRLTVTHACRSCGSGAHGTPRVVVAGDGPDVHVSLSRSGGMTIVAVSDVGVVGIDVEAVVGDMEELTAWVRTESLVKATGHGLTIDPAELDDVVRRTIDLDAPAGFVAALTILTDVPPPVVVTRLGAAPGA